MPDSFSMPQGHDQPLQSPKLGSALQQLGDAYTNGIIARNQFIQVIDIAVRTSIRQPRQAPIEECIPAIISAITDQPAYRKAYEGLKERTENRHSFVGRLITADEKSKAKLGLILETIGNALTRKEYPLPRTHFNDIMGELAFNGNAAENPSELLSILLNGARHLPIYPELEALEKKLDRGQKDGPRYKN